MNTNTGNRIRNAAEAVGLICGIGAVLLGVSYWITLRSWIGFLLFVVVAGFGMFFAWLWKIVISGFGELVANSGEGITLLRKLSENINAPTPEAEPMAERKPVEIVGNPELVQIVRSTETTTKEETKVDGREMIAKFDSRNNLTIDCPICFKRQSSRRDDCFNCGCKFVYNDEANTENN